MATFPTSTMVHCRFSPSNEGFKLIQMDEFHPELSSGWASNQTCPFFSTRPDHSSMTDNLTWWLTGFKPFVMQLFHAFSAKLNYFFLYAHFSVWSKRNSVLHWKECEHLQDFEVQVAAACSLLQTVSVPVPDTENHPGLKEHLGNWKCDKRKSVVDKTLSARAQVFTRRLAFQLCTYMESRSVRTAAWIQRLGQRKERKACTLRINWCAVPVFFYWRVYLFFRCTDLEYKRKQHVPEMSSETSQK